MNPIEEYRRGQVLDEVGQALQTVSVLWALLPRVAGGQTLSEFLSPLFDEAETKSEIINRVLALSPEEEAIVALKRLLGIR